MKRFECLMLAVLIGLASIVSGCGSTSDDSVAESTKPIANDNPYPIAEDNYKGLRAGFGKVPILRMSSDISGYWMAGFFIFRPVSGIHDPIYAVATVIDDGSKRIGVVALDAFSWRYEDTLEVRQSIPSSLKIDHLIVHALHNHEVPDNNGMWSILNPESKNRFIDLLKAAAVEAVKDAVANLQPAVMYTDQIMDKDRLNVPDPLKAVIVNSNDVNGINQLANPNEFGLTDLRPPYVTDNGVRFAVFKTIDNKQVIGSIVNWGNHVESLWRNNQMISADFPGYLRDELSKRIGGTTLYITGNVGAVTTPEYEPEVFFNKEKNEYETINITTGVTYNGMVYYGATDISMDTKYSAVNFEKTWALGSAIAKAVADEVDSGNIEINPEPKINVYKEYEPGKVTFEMPIENSKFALMYNTGIMDRQGREDENGTLWVTTEMNLLTLGNLWILTIPGELYPEIAVGGIYVPNDVPNAGEVGDYYSELPQDKSNSSLKAAVEIPPLRTLMKGKVNMIMNLGNDHLGYMIPKSQWDEKKPFMLGYEKAPYGEENSIGPNAAGTIHEKARKLLEQVQN